MRGPLRLRTRPFGTLPPMVFPPAYSRDEHTRQEEQELEWERAREELRRLEEIAPDEDEGT